MSTIAHNDPKNSLILFELDDKLKFLIKLYNSNNLPRTLMISGKKGVGKFTLINHFINYIYDTSNYNLENKTINHKSKFYKEYLNEVFFNIVYLSGENFKNVNVEKIRDLKSSILKTTLSKGKRFIILDDIELFNNNSLNALLKIIEEPLSNNYFIIINNKTKPLLETIYSRSVEIKILLSNLARTNIIKSLIKKYNLEVHIDYNSLDISPGNFLSFNSICIENKINIDEDYLQNLKKLFLLYKKSKDKNLINLILFLTDYYFYKLEKKNLVNIEKIIDMKSFVISNINKFLTFNLNQNSLINAINNKLLNE